MQKKVDLNGYIIKDSVISAGLQEYCEDMIITHDHYVGILDGVTSFNPQKTGGYPSEPCWFVNSFRHCFENCDEMYCDCTATEEICRKICLKLKELYPVRSSDSIAVPSSAAVICDFGDENIKATFYSDCRLYVKKKNGETLFFSDTRHNDADELLQKIYESHFADEKERKGAVRKQSAENRKKMNQDGGYYLLTLGDDFYGHGINISLPKSDTDALLLCSDGFDRLFSGYCIASVKSILDGEITLDEAKKLIRNYESDSEHVSMIKKSDDISAVLISKINLD